MPDAVATQSLRIQSFGEIVFVEPIPRGRLVYAIADERTVLVSSQDRTVVLTAAERVVEVPTNPVA